MLQLHKAQHFSHARLDLVGRHAVFMQPVRHVLRNRQGVEQSSFLKHEADLAAKRQQFFLFHFRYFLAQHVDASAVRPQ